MFFDSQNINNPARVGDSVTLGAIDWNAIINQGFAVGSQAISAFSGQTRTTQVGYNAGTNSIFAIQSTPNYDDQYLRAGYAPVGGGVGGAAGQYPAGGGVAEDALGSIGNLVSQHPYMVFGAIAGLYLLMREPPRSRR